MPGRIGSKSIEIMTTKFDQALITGQIWEKFIEITPSSQWKINTKLHNTSEVDLASKSAGFIKLLHF